MNAGDFVTQGSRAPSWYNSRDPATRCWQRDSSSFHRKKRHVVCICHINRHFLWQQFPANVRYHRTDLCGPFSHCSCTGIPCRDQKYCLYDISYVLLGAILAIYNGLRMRTTLGKFDWGFRYVIIFLYVQFWIRLAAASYCDKKVRTVAFPAARSVNKWRDTRNCVQNVPEYTICVRFTTHLHYKALGMIVCALIWQIRHNYNRPGDGHCDVTGHRKVSALGTAGAMVTTHENSVMVSSFKGPNCLSFCKTYWKWKRVTGFTL